MLWMLIPCQPHHLWKLLASGRLSVPPIIVHPYPLEPSTRPADRSAVRLLNKYLCVEFLLCASTSCRAEPWATHKPDTSRISQESIRPALSSSPPHRWERETEAPRKVETHTRFHEKNEAEGGFKLGSVDSISEPGLCKLQLLSQILHITCFGNTVKFPFSWNTNPSIPLYTVHSCFHATRTDLSSCKRNCMACKD